MARRAALLLLLLGCAPRTPPGRVNTSGPLAAFDWGPTAAFLDSAVRSGAMPGAVLGVSERGARMVYGTGRLGRDDPTHPDSATVYDLASLTKVVVLTTLAMMAVDEGLLALDTPVVRYVPAFTGGDKDRVTIRHLLTHSSGLPPWRPLFREAPTRDSALALVLATPLEHPPGEVTAYSDLGAMVLTLAVEHVFGARIDTLAERKVFGPLGMATTRYLPPADWLPRIAPTENDPWRGHVIRGEVHDENAARLGGVSGHAGLFSTVPDLLTFGEWLVSGLTSGEPRRFSIRPPESERRFVRRQDVVPGSSRALGWDTPSGRSSAGTLMGSGSFGHTGFTGTSIWIDTDRQLVIVLLTNRVHPSRENSRIGPVRSGVADLVVRTLDPGAAPREADLAR